jgi:hypothetical protein
MHFTYSFTQRTSNGCTKLDNIKTTLGKNIYFQFEVLTALIMKSFIFWYIMLCTTLKDNSYFGET